LKRHRKNLAAGELFAVQQLLISMTNKKLDQGYIATSRAAF
jgi:hypothetical protein